MFNDASLCLEDEHFTQLLVEKGYTVHVMSVKVSQLISTQVLTTYATISYYYLLTYSG